MVTALIAFMIPTLGMATKVGRDEAIAESQAEQMESILILVEKKDQASKKRVEKLTQYIIEGHNNTSALRSQVGTIETVVSRIEPKLDGVISLQKKYGEDIAVLKAQK